MSSQGRTIVYDEIGYETEIVVEISGNNRYIVVTRDTIYVGSAGLEATGAFFGKKVKKYPLDTISSVEVLKAMFTVELELVTAGSVESNNAGHLARKLNENITSFPSSRYDEVQAVANTILELRRGLVSSASATVSGQSIPEQLEQLAGLLEKGILSEDEFQSKKTELLSRM